MGKSKATLNKAIKEIEEYMKDPSVSFTTSQNKQFGLFLCSFLFQASEIVVTPARQTSAPKIRKPNVSADGSLNDTNDTSTVESADEKSTPVKSPVAKVPIAKRSMVRSTLKIKVSNQVTLHFLFTFWFFVAWQN